MAVDFDGVDQHINTGNWNPPTGISQLTIMCWARKTADVGIDSRMIMRADGTGTMNSEFGLDLPNSGGGTYRFRFTTTSSSTHTIITSAATPMATLGEWHHLAATWQASSSQRVFLYADGVRDVNTGSRTGNLRQLNKEFWIGANPPTATDRPFAGDLDDVRIYFRELGQQEIQTIVAAKGGDNIVDGIQARWPLMDHAVGVVAGSAADIGPNGLSGVGVNDPLFTNGILRGDRRRRR